MFNTILFPIDLSPEAEQAASLAVDLVNLHQSRLIVLSVVESDIGEASQASSQTSPAAVARLLTQAKSLFAEKGVSCETLEREGQPAFVICDVADEINADLIVMGCRGIGLIEEAKTESVTNRVINLSPCPVLVVP
ncbi:MAG: universal stress protein [Leptolyngbyaceae cyanobacterium SM1_1_3]|nr:universal stress protein [Leptolyngbyaceae cyanobacterium SM1_1_3]NJN01929.1 universal stress protein [Leptolyngbyaceae cyanobacterium RM1_1_2]NJO10241.1 universal stress protein [Leptolyngbyaceae cyanobacterium SL_1_1]